MPLFHLLVWSACSICLEFPRIVWHRKTKIAVRWISFAQCHILHTLLATNDYKAEVLKMPYPLQKYLMIACCLFVFSAGCQKPESASVGAQGETVQSQQALAIFVLCAIFIVVETHVAVDAISPHVHVAFAVPRRAPNL